MSGERTHRAGEESRAFASHLGGFTGGRVVVKEQLGAGAMGTVYRARDNSRRIDVALKSLRSVEGSALLRFKNEFRSLSGIVHPNLVTLYELFSHDDQWSFTMALVEGDDFLEYVRPHQRELVSLSAVDSSADDTFVSDRAGNNSDAETVETCDSARSGSSFSAYSGRARGKRQAVVTGSLQLGRLRASLPQLVAAVQALHDAGKLHRDLKPSNVIVQPDGRVVVCDFGLVADASANDHTNSRSIVGTPIYMSPEQAAGKPHGPASDWYSLGVMMYEALTGYVPFDGRIKDILRDKVAQEAPAPSVHGPIVDGAEDLAELCVALLQRDPTKRPSGSAIMAALGRPSEEREILAPAVRRSETLFVGREAEMAQLQRALRDSRGERGVAVFVHGHSGIGKSALISEFLRTAEDETGALVLRGRCYERENVPYKALDALVDALSNHLMELPAQVVSSLIPRDIPSLAQLFPVIGRIPVDDVREKLLAAPSDRQEARQRAIGALRTLLAGLADRTPLILYIDDLQWGDRDSAPFLNDLIHDAAAPRLLLVASYRTIEADSSPILRAVLDANNAAGGTGEIRQIALEEMSADEARLLALRALGAGDSNGDGDDLANADVEMVAETISTEARGNPYFVTELVRGLAARGDITNPASQSLDELLAARMSRLPEEAHMLLQTTAVAGHPTPVAIVGRASGVRDEAAALAVLQAEHFVRTRQSTGTGANEEIEPYHDRIRETMVATLSEDDVRRIHRRLARAIESSGAADDSRLVTHWLGAGDKRRGAEYAIKAATQAADSLAFTQAAYYFGKVLELGELTDEQRQQVRIYLAECLASAGKLVESAAICQEAAEHAERDLALELRRMALAALLRSANMDEGLALANDLMREVGLRLPKGRVSILLGILSRRLWLKIRGTEFKIRSRDEIAREEIRKLDVCWELSSSLTMLDPTFATSFQMHHLVNALRTGDPYHISLALSMETGYRSLPGGVSPEQQAALSKPGRDLACELGDPHAIGLYYGTSTIASFLNGRYRDSLEFAREGERQLLQDAGGTRYMAGVIRNYRVACEGGQQAPHSVGSIRYMAGIIRNYRLASLVYLGQFRELTRLVPVQLREAVECGDEFTANTLRGGRASIAWLALGTPKEARRQAGLATAAENGRGPFHMHHFFGLMTNVHIDLYCGERAAAWQRFQTNERALKKSLLLRVQSMRLEAAFLEGRCALASAEGSARKQRLAIATACARRLENNRVPHGDPLAYLLRAAVARAHGDDHTALTLLERAHTGFHAVDMEMLSAVCQRRRGEILGGDEGAMLVRKADEWMESENIVDPPRMTDVYAPGFDGM